MALTLTCLHCGRNPKLPPNMPSVIVCPYCHKSRSNPDVSGGNEAWLPAPVEKVGGTAVGWGEYDGGLSD
jgi:hypothetical protein